MFKKLKDKIEEEFKQSPLRLTASVQQIAQAISPSPSVNSLNDNANTASHPLPDALSVSSDCFSIGDDQDSGDSSKTLHNIDLNESTLTSLPTTRSRLSSISSVASDVSSLYPIYESPLNHSFLQSEWESEVEDNVVTQLEKISKEQLYQGYKKLLHRYNKYKSRFLDVARLHKDLQHEHIKTKNILQESQDKALRRIAELREQCQLEQKAKAHLEESLRNDLEERDHVITTLNTKISLLKSGSTLVDDQLPDVQIISESSPDLISRLTKQNQELFQETTRLQTLVESMNTSNASSQEVAGSEQVKEKITELKSGIIRMKSETESISNLLSKSPSTSEAGDEGGALIDFGSPELDEKDKKIDKLNNLLLKCKEKISGLNGDIRKKNAELKELTDRISALTDESVKEKESIAKLENDVQEMRSREEANILTIAENKMAIHKELEGKEAQIRDLSANLKAAKDEATRHAATLVDLQLQVQTLKEANEDITSQESDLLQAFTGTKEAVENGIEALIRSHQDKLTSALTGVEEKIKRTEEKCVKMCSDRMVNGRSIEMELRQNIADLESKLADSGINNIRVEELEKEIKALEATVIEKQRIIDEKATAMDAVNVELSEKIDRLFQLGVELEDTREAYTIKLATLESQLLSVSKGKEQSEQECINLQKLCDELTEKITSVTDENVQVKEQCKKQMIEVTENCQKTVSKAQNEVGNYVTGLTQSKENMMMKDAEIKNLIRKTEQLTERNKTLSETLAKGEELLLAARTDLENMVEESSQIKKKNEELMCEITNKNDELSKCKVELEHLTTKLNETESKFTEKTAQLEEANQEVLRISKLLEENNNEICTVKQNYEAELSTSRKLLDEANLEVLRLTKVLDENSNEVSANLDTTRKELDALNAQLLSAKTDHKGEMDKISSEFQTALDDSLKVNSKLEIELQRNREILEKTNAEIDFMKLDFKAQLDSSHKELERVKSELDSLKVEHSENNEKSTEFMKEIDNLLRVKSELESELERSRELLEKNNEAMDAMKRDFESQLEITRDELNTVQSESEQLQIAHYEELTRKSSEFEEKLEEFIRTKSEVDGNLQANSELIRENNIKIDALTIERQHALDELQSLKLRIERENSALSEENHKITEELAAVKSTLDSERNQYKESLSDAENKLQMLFNTHEQLILERDQLSQSLRNITIENERLAEDAHRKSNAALSDQETKIESLTNEINMAKCELLQVKQNAEENLDKVRIDSESKVTILKNEIQFLNDKFEQDIANMERNRELEAAENRERQEHSEKMARELLVKLETVAAERDELKTACDEKSLKLSELEGCLADLKSDLDRNFNDTSHIALGGNYDDKLKNLVNNFEVELARRDDKIRDLEQTVLDNSDAVADLQRLREEVRKLRKELKEKDDFIEMKTEEFENLRRETENRILQMKSEAVEQLQFERNRQENELKKQTEFVEIELKRNQDNAEHLHEVEKEKMDRELSFKKQEAEFIQEKNNWVSEKKINGDFDAESAITAIEHQELERTSQVAIAAMESSTNSMDLLRQEIIHQSKELTEIKKQHKREIIELKKLAALRSRRESERERDGDDVEHEYLRNILYEYMMGREQMVLAKVLAAIVKFDRQQTQNILERQSSVNQLRIL